jgi:MHS family proline/betaine transporter-like MFS transporter
VETVAGLAVPVASQRNWALIAGVLGNALEWFDFSVYGSLIPTISRLFFPSEDALASLLLSFGVYGIGFFVRPAGSVLFGIYGDRFGRRKALSAVIFLMGFSTLAIGLLPTYQQVGVLAPILLVVVRVVQGLSAGGEWGGSAAYLVEFAPQDRRGFFGSLQQVSLVSGFLLGTLCAALINQVLDQDAVQSWGWRLPFFFGLVLGFLGAYLRWRLDDTPKFVELETRGNVSRAPLLEAFTTYRSATAVIFGVNLHNAVASNIAMTYMTSHIISQAHLSVLTALWINTVCLSVYVALIPLWGGLSDRYGRKPFLLLSAGGFIVFSYPLFMLVSFGNLYLVD